MRWFLIPIMISLLGSEASVASLPVVDNPQEAPRVSAVHYEEVWRAGADESEEFLLGVIRDAVSDAHGNIYLLDTQQQQVFKFSAAGEYLGLVSRKGEGPGEINMVYRIYAPGGGRIALAKGFPAKFVMVDTAGIPLPGITLDVAPVEGKNAGFGSLYDAAFFGEHLVATGMIMHGDGMRQDNTSFVARFDQEGKEIRRLAQWSTGYDFTKPITVDEPSDFQPFNDWDMDRHGRVYCTIEREAYLIQVDSPEGVPLFRIRREWPVHRRTAEEKEKAKGDYSFSSNVDLPPISYNMADTDPAIHGLTVHGDELWITSMDQRRNPPEGVARAVSVFDLEGHLVEDRHFMVPMDKDEDLLRYLPDSRLVRVKAFRSAHAAASASSTVQTGEKRRTSEDFDDEEILEVIVYRPVSR
jgi:hypothetical protein